MKSNQKKKKIEREKWKNYRGIIIGRERHCSKMEKSKS